MTRSSIGRLLLAIGGLAMAAGSFLPELAVFAGNALHPGRGVAMPERSHWVVFQECEDMLADPDPTLPSHYYTYYRVEAGGVAYFAVAGLAFALSAGFARSRVVASVFVAFHAIAFLALAAGAYVVWSSESEAEGTTTTRTLGIVALFLGALGLFEALLGIRAVRGGRLGRLHAVDGANFLPAAFFLLVGAGLFAALWHHPNWPAGGYLLTAAGAAAVLVGMRIRREAATGRTPAPAGTPNRASH